MPINRTDGSPAHHKQAMRAAQKKLDELYKSLGVRTYACMKERELGLPELELIKKEIDETMRSLDSSAAEIERIKAMKQVAKGASCPQCGMKAPAGSVMCPYCGVKIVAQPEAAPADTDSVDLIMCPHCQGEITADAAWCGLCGKEVFEQVIEPAPVSPAASGLVEAPDNVVAIGDKVVSLEAAAVRDGSPMIERPMDKVPERPLSDTSLRGAPKPPPPPEPAPVEPAVVSQKKCLACGEVQRRAAGFCFNCGEKLG